MYWVLQRDLCSSRESDFPHFPPVVVSGGPSTSRSRGQFCSFTTDDFSSSEHFWGKFMGCLFFRPFPFHAPFRLIGSHLSLQPSSVLCMYSQTPFFPNEVKKFSFFRVFSSREKPICAMGLALETPVTFVSPPCMETWGENGKSDVTSFPLSKKSRKKPMTL